MPLHAACGGRSAAPVPGRLWGWPADQLGAPRWVLANRGGAEASPQTSRSRSRGWTGSSTGSRCAWPGHFQLLLDPEHHACDPVTLLAIIVLEKHNTSFVSALSSQSYHTTNVYVPQPSIEPPAHAAVPAYTRTLTGAVGVVVTCLSK